ncbi:MAG: type II secretion system F family protein [Candidatus Omnitrophica bacterium]|nr:type II secretion system F family protein [Candidatus Omnitrophota bacterium]
MAAFAYTARNRTGLMETGELEAQNQDTALTVLQERGLVVTSVTPRSPVSAAKVARHKGRRHLHRGVKVSDLLLVCTQLSTMLEASVPLLRALQVIQAQVESRRLLEALEEISSDIQAGKSFRDAIAKHPKIFSRFWVSLIETGEASGQLGLTLRQLERQLETAGQTKRKVASALIYPAVLLLVALIAMAVFMFYIVPVFSRVFAQFHLELPLLTRLVLGVSTVIRHQFVVVVALAIGAGIGLRRYRRTSVGRRQFDWLSLRLPVMGPLLYELHLASLARGLDTLLKSGVPVLFALEIIEHNMENVIFEEAVAEVRLRVKEGRSLAELFAQNALFPPMVVQMVAVGEEVGQLGEMLGRVAAFYEDRIETYLARLASLFEPVALLVVGTLVGIMVLAMYFPMFKLMGGGGIH